MKFRTIGLLAALFAVAVGTATPSTASKSVRHLVYEFGYNTKAVGSGQGTGTTEVEILGPAADGGLMVTAADHWWNTPRARAKNTCEVYPDGSVSCLQAPYAISPIQLTLFPLLGRNYFQQLSGNGTGNWSHKYHLKAAVVPGATGFAGQLTTWDCTFDMHGKGHASDAPQLVLISGTGQLTQQGGRHWKASVKQNMAYDPVRRLPVEVHDIRTHLPMKSVYSNDSIHIKLTKDSGAAH